MSRPFNPDMLSIARRARGMTQEVLVTKARGAFSQPTLSRIESGLQKPTSSEAEALARALGFRQSFFYHPVYRRAMPATFHRKRQKLSAATWEHIFAQAEIYRICLSVMLSSTEITPVRKAPVPLDVDEFGGEIEEIAKSIRQLWLLPRGPIPDVSSLFEGAGIVVIGFDFGTDLIDGFSEHANDNLPPLIFFNSRQSRERLRFTLSHELGHLVMHQAPKPEMEEEANRFAAEILLPSDDIGGDFYTTSLDHFMVLKLKWRVSLQAIVRKAYTLNKITERSYRYYMMEISKKWGRVREPVPLPDTIERPRIWNQLVNAHLNKLGYTVEELSQAFGLLEPEVRERFVREAPKLRVVGSV